MRTDPRSVLTFAESNGGEDAKTVRADLRSVLTFTGTDRVRRKSRQGHWISSRRKGRQSHLGGRRKWHGIFGAVELYLKECRRIAVSLVYFLLLAVLVLQWLRDFQGVTQREIGRVNGKTAAGTDFDRPLLSQPSREDGYFGNKVSEDDPDAIMTGVTRALLSEYKENCYAAYPFGYYKAVVLSDEKQKRVLEILCEITGLTKEQLDNLPADYFPAVTGTIFSPGAMSLNADGSYTLPGNNVASGDSADPEKPADAENSADIENSADTGDPADTGNPTGTGNSADTGDFADTGDPADTGNSADEGNSSGKQKHFASQVTYERFRELMREMESLIGEKGSRYSREMMLTYFGMSEMDYEEAEEEYRRTIGQDQVTGGFARLFCDYMGLALGLYPVFLVVFLWMKDRGSGMEALICSRKVSSAKLLLSRYLAGVTMVLLPVCLLSLESLVPLLSFGTENSIPVDYFAYVRYIAWWLLPEVMAVCGVGTFFTLLTDSPIAIVIQFLWWMADKGITGLSGSTGFATLMIRHNTLRGYEIIRDEFPVICRNRLFVAGIGMLSAVLSIWVLAYKRKGKINAADYWHRCMESVQNKLSSGNKK